MNQFFMMTINLIFFISTLLMILGLHPHQPIKLQEATSSSQPVMDAAQAAALAAEDAAAKSAENAARIAARQASASIRKLESSPIAADPASSRFSAKGIPLKFSHDAEIHAIGVYEAENPNKVVWWQKCGELSHVECHRKYAGQHDEETIEVNINYSKKPIVLVLSAYEPINWKINVIKGQIEGVILAGYYGQRISGISSNIPIHAYTYKSSSCLCSQDDNYFYSYESNDTQFQQKIYQLTGKNISSFQGKYSGKSFYLGNMN